MLYELTSKRVPQTLIKTLIQAITQMDALPSIILLFYCRILY